MAIEKNWFTIVKIDNQTFALREENHDEETNSFLLLGEKKALLIDAGMGVKNIFDTIKSFTNKEIIVAITHAHWDHIGDIDKVDYVMINKNEAGWLKKFPISLKQVRLELLKTSSPFPKGFNVNNYKIPIQTNIKFIEDNDIIDLGSRKIKCIFTPGHSPGHTSFYDLNNHYLFSGDLVYKGELDCYYDSTNPSQYRDSVHKLSLYNISYIFGGHHDLFLPRTILDETINAFDYLYSTNNLKHQNKIFKFKNISIRL